MINKLLPKIDEVDKKYILNELVPDILKSKYNKYNLANYDGMYVDCFGNGTYIMFSNNDVFVSPCNENGTLIPSIGKSRRYKNIIPINIYTSIKSKSDTITTESVVKNAANLGII